jgi:thiol:disulfide interchange protein DsbC
MTPTRHPRTALLLALTTVAGCAASNAAPPLPPALADLSTPMQASVQLRGTGVQMLELADRVVYIAGNGRYVFTGTAWDLWHGEQLASVAQASALAGRIDLSRMQLDPAELGAFTVGLPHAGTPAAQQDTAPLWVFVDPLCMECALLLGTLDQVGAAAHVVLLPASGDKSLDIAQRLRCAPSEKAAWTALRDQDWSDLPEPTADCDKQPLVRALITARLLGLTAVPTLIAPDGRLHQGAPTDLTTWLAGE